MCQPGSRLTSHCTALEKTQCHPCDSGEFSAQWNREIRCHQHRHCEPNQGLRVKKEGTAESDTVCTCKEGQHCTSKDCEACAQHTPCIPGFGVMEMATETTDTVCHPCPVGFFSNQSSLFEKCYPWTSCEDKNLEVLQKGTSQTNVICGESRGEWPCQVFGKQGTGERLRHAGTLTGIGVRPRGSLGYSTLAPVLGAG